MASRRKSSSKSTTGMAASKRASLFTITVGAVLLLALVFLVLAIWNPDSSHSELDRLTAFKKSGELKFVGASGDELRAIDIEIADTESRRQVGLMYRKPLDDSQGMLFVFPEQAELGFWMRNTPISIDMVFADSTGRIVTVYKEARPFDQTQYRSTSPAMYVVEVAAGFTDRYGVLVGDGIDWQRTDTITQ